MILRTISEEISKRLHSGKAIVILGARQVGKTTLLHSLFSGREDVLWLSGDEPDVRVLFENATSTRLSSYIGKMRIVVIDEAQRISAVGTKLKLITDYMPGIQLVATGSSSFELANETNEPLTGRKWEYELFPLSFAEMVAEHGLLEEKRMLPHRLVYGYYPDVVTHPGDEREVLATLAASYLYKDIFTADKIKKSDSIVKLLSALAYQVGSEVSSSELGQLCGIDPKTVERYITMLEQAYIIFRLPSFSRNMRNELKHSRKIYFYDNGIRNAVIGNYAHVEMRNDVGQLFENFAVAERIKQQRYAKTYSRPWFWRTTSRQEIDYLEDVDGKLSAYEIKWNAKRKVSPPLSFRNAYPDATFGKVTPDNIEEFLGV